MASSKTPHWEAVLHLNILCLHLTGLWPKSKYKLDLYTVYASLLLSSLLLFFILEAVELYNAASNLPLFTDILLYLMVQLLGSVKMYTLVLNGPQLKTLLRTTSQLGVINTTAQNWSRLYTLFMGCVICTFILWIFLPFITGDGGLPAPIYCPGCGNTPVRYIVAYVLESYLIGNIVIGVYNVDMFAFAMFYAIQDQCTFLASNLRGLRPGWFRTELIKCIEQHRNIIKFVAKLNDISSFIIFAQFVVSTILIAVILFQVNMMTPGNFIFYSRVGAAICYFLQNFAYCWFGEQIQSKSNNFERSLFDSKWINEAISVKKLLVICAINCRRPLSISGLNLFNLSLEVFVKILKSAWSWLMILNQISSKSDK